MDNIESIDEEEASSEELNQELRQNELDEGPMLIQSQEDSDENDHSITESDSDVNESSYDTEIDSETTIYKFM